MDAGTSPGSEAQQHNHYNDQPSQRSRWVAACEGVLIPLGSIFAIFLFMLGVMLITD